MAFPTVDIVYSTNKKIVRRVHKNNYATPGSGESVLRVPTTQYDSQGPELCLVNAGMVPGDPRCAVVSSNTVVDVINADAEIDAIPGATLINNSAVQIGWAVNGGILIDPKDITIG